ncbi:unnamed protein product [Gongylonema pulchrum]|uniref:Aldedh domain-containing protein n=1 Tax=Gongylonema pulchrum TaxID=637853 RepID=A0A183EU06_9BILA|nr:unnamed protein product [Gongylonema pulchrum]
MRTITEEAASVWAKPSAKITELIEQFKHEAALYAEKARQYFFGDRASCGIAFDIDKFQSEQISKLATIYSKMHPESTYSHVHEHWYLPKRYFGVHT